MKLDLHAAFRDVQIERDLFGTPAVVVGTMQQGPVFDGQLRQRGRDHGPAGRHVGVHGVGTAVKAGPGLVVGGHGGFRNSRSTQTCPAAALPRSSVDLPLVFLCPCTSLPVVTRSRVPSGSPPRPVSSVWRAPGSGGRGFLGCDQRQLPGLQPRLDQLRDRGLPRRRARRRGILTVGLCGEDADGFGGSVGAHPVGRAARVAAGGGRGEADLVLLVGNHATAHRLAAADSQMAEGFADLDALGHPAHRMAIDLGGQREPVRAVQGDQPDVVAVRVVVDALSERADGGVERAVVDGHTASAAGLVAVPRRQQPRLAVLAAYQETRGAAGGLGAARGGDVDADSGTDRLDRRLRDELLHRLGAAHPDHSGQDS